MNGSDRHMGAVRSVFAVFGDLWSRVKTGLLLVVIAGLVMLNIATLVNDTAHKVAYDLVAAVSATAIVAAIAHALSSEPMLSNSPTAKRRDIESRRAALESENKNLKVSADRRKKAVQSISQRIAQRTAAGAMRSARGLVGRSIPYVGVALNTTLTALDLRDACETIKDINALDSNVGGAGNAADASVCGMQIPGW